MAVNLSMLAGAGAQFFDNNGVILSGGLIYTYAAGTTTPQAAYTTSSGSTAHTNPIVLDSAGRVASGGEIWLTEGVAYKFVLQTSAAITIGTYDNVTGNASGVATGIYATFAASSGSSLVGYLPTGGTATTVQAKLRQYISVQDFGAVGDGTTNDTSAIQNALNQIGSNGTVYIPAGTYLVDSLFFPTDIFGLNFVGSGMNSTIFLMNDPVKPIIKIATGVGRNYNSNISDFAVKANAASSIVDSTQIAIDCNGFDGATFSRIRYLSNGASGSVGVMFRTSAAPNLTYQQTFDTIVIQQQRGPNVVLSTENNGLGYLSNTNIIEVKNCWIYANTNIATILDMANCTSYSIHNNEFETAGDYAIRLGNSGLITSNWFELQNVAPLLFQNTESVTSSNNTFIGNYFSGFSGVINIPTSCDENLFINNPGGTYSFSTTIPNIINGNFPAAPTLAKTVGGAGTLTLVSANLVSTFDGTYELLYTFLPSAGPANYGFTLTPPTGVTIKKLNASAYDGANAVPYVCSVTFPNSIFYITAPNTNLVNLNIQLTYQ